MISSSNSWSSENSPLFHQNFHSPTKESSLCGNDGLAPSNPSPPLLIQFPLLSSAEPEHAAFDDFPAFQKHSWIILQQQIFTKWLNRQLMATPLNSTMLKSVAEFPEFRERRVLLSKEIQSGRVSFKHGVDFAHDIGLKVKLREMCRLFRNEWLWFGISTLQTLSNPSSLPSISQLKSLPLNYQRMRKNHLMDTNRSERKLVELIEWLLSPSSTIENVLSLICLFDIFKSFYPFTPPLFCSASFIKSTQAFSDAFCRYADLRN